MKKKFNTTGVCYPDLHYMMENSQKLKEIMELVDFGEYFTINRPRQYGKSTTLHQLEDTLRGKYLPVKMNFQGIDNKWHESDEAFATMFLHQLYDFFEYDYTELAAFIETQQPLVDNMDKLSKVITRLMRQSSRKIVLLIDEVDASSSYEAFLSFLGMLRTKYLDRYSSQHTTFHSIVLAGVHDIKSLKFKLRNPHDAQYNSPWNIAVDFNVRMSFNPVEIAPMLEQYCAAEGVTMDIPAIAERLYYHTSGYPFLVSKLCKNIAEIILAKRSKSERDKWTLEEVEESVQLLLKEKNTNFDSLIGNMENNPSLYKLAYEVIINGANIPFNPDEPVTDLGRMYGIFKANGRLKIHNRIYEQRLYNYMAAKTRQTLIEREEYDFSTNFVLPDNTLDLKGVLLQFQQFMKEQRSKKDKRFIERQWRLVFLAFLKPIIAYKGYDFKEVETSDEKRLDVVVTFYNRRYILELKIWRGTKNHEKGLEQLADYLDIHGVDKGYLLIFDNRKKPTYESDSVNIGGKEIFAVWL